MKLSATNPCEKWLSKVVSQRPEPSGSRPAVSATALFSAYYIRYVKLRLEVLTNGSDKRFGGERAARVRHDRVESERKQDRAHGRRRGRDDRHPELVFDRRDHLEARHLHAAREHEYVEVVRRLGQA